MTTDKQLIKERIIMEAQIYGKSYNVFTKVSDTVEDYKITSLISVIIYDNGLVFYDNRRDKFFLYLSIEEYIKQESCFVGLEFIQDVYTCYEQISWALIRDTKTQDVVILIEIIKKIAELFHIE